MHPTTGLDISDPEALGPRHLAVDDQGEGRPGHRVAVEVGLYPLAHLADVEVAIGCRPVCWRGGADQQQGAHHRDRGANASGSALCPTRAIPQPSLLRRFPP